MYLRAQASAEGGAIFANGSAIMMVDSNAFADMRAANGAGIYAGTLPAQWYVAGVVGRCAVNVAAVDVEEMAWHSVRCQSRSKMVSRCVCRCLGYLTLSGSILAHELSAQSTRHYVMYDRCREHLHRRHQQLCAAQRRRIGGRRRAQLHGLTNHEHVVRHIPGAQLNNLYC